MAHVPGPQSDTQHCPICKENLRNIPREEMASPGYARADGTITQEFYDQKSSEWRAEQSNILGKIERHQNANRSYLDEGIKLLELSQQTAKLYEKQPMREKRKILNFVCSNSVWKDGCLYPTYRQPFEILAVAKQEYQQKKAVSHSENDLRLVKRGRRDLNSRPPA